MKAPRPKATAIAPAILAASLCALLQTGCTTASGCFNQSTGTGVSLSQGNYRIVRANARGESTGFALLGIIPLAKPRYARAKQNLYDSVGEPLSGRAIALANQTEDRSTLYLILFSLPKLTLTADIIEFVDSPADAARQGMPAGMPPARSR
jgi:hypothetical protein